MAFFTITSNEVTLLANQASSPGTGWSSVTNVQAAFDQARTSGTPLFIQPGTYATSEIDITTTTGSGKPLWVYAIPGAVTLQFTSGNTLFYIAGIASRIEGLVFDGNNAAFSNPSDSSALLTITGGTDIHVEHCVFTRSTETGVYIESGAVGEISKCDVNLCSYAIWSQDSQFIIKSNTIENCTNGGVRVWRSSVTGDSSSVTDNFINTIGSQSGTGANGNGINIFQAVGVTVIGNRIANCQYSAIRFNSGGDAVISGNACYNSRETAIFIEAPAPGSFFNGGVVSGNIVDGAGDGIKAVNLGETGQGTARRVTITGNTISSIVKRTINDPGYVPTVGVGSGITVEGDCVVSGNLIDMAAGFGVIVGTNTAARNLNINGNTVLNSAIGIGFSTVSGAGQLLISGNMVQGASGGSIVPVYLDGSTGAYTRVSGSADYGNQYDAQISNAFLGNNRSF